MKTVFPALWIVLLALCVSVHGAETLQYSGISYLDNGAVRIGINPDIGGAITYLSKSGSDENIVNSHAANAEEVSPPNTSGNSTGAIAPESKVEPRGAWRSAQVRLVDEDGNPIVGARVSLRSFSTSSGAFARADIDPSTNLSYEDSLTDDTGHTVVHLPKMNKDGVAIDSMFCIITHPDYVSFNLGYHVNATETDTVVLERGASLEVSASLNGTPLPSKRVLVVMSTLGNEHQLYGTFGTLEDTVAHKKNLLPGEHSLLLGYWDEQNEFYCSQRQNFTAEKGRHYVFDVPLGEGIPLRGRLDKTVARPVKNGVVLIRALPPKGEKSGSTTAALADWTTIAPDGTFSFASLPAGDVELFALCDGASSKVLASEVSDFPPGKMGAQPLRFPIGNDEILVPMEDTSTFEAHVVDAEGKPVADARLFFRPAIFLEGYKCTILEAAFYRNMPANPQGGNKHELSFSSVSDARGRVIIRNIPRWLDEYKLFHDDYVLAASQQDSHCGLRGVSLCVRLSGRAAVLRVGQTTKVTIRLRPKQEESRFSH